MRKIILVALIVGVVLGGPTPMSAAGAGAAGCAAAKVPVGAGAAAAASATAVPTQEVGPALPAHLSTAGSTAAVETKECILDGLTVAIREALIATITQSIIDWINNGFEGSPAFVTDPTGFLRDVADKIGVEFILGEELNFLCSPFQLQVRLALSTKNRPFERDIQCSLGDVSNNIEGFLSGDFSQGGWPAWFRLSTDIQNNPYGAYFLAEAELENRQASAVYEQEREWSWSNGLFSKKKCVEYGSSLGPDSVTDASGLPAICLKYEIVTPGTAIEHQLNETLGSGMDQLELADEIDEIIGALLQQLAQKALTSLDGLRGLSSNSSSSAVDGVSYLDQLTQTTGDNATAAAKDVLLLDIARSVGLETEYQAVLNDTLVILANEKALLSSCLSGVETGTGISLASVGMKTQQYRNALAAATSTSAALLAIEQRVEAAATATALNAAGAQYDALAQSGALQTSTTFERAAGARDLEQLSLDALITAGGTQCTEIQRTQ